MQELFRGKLLSPTTGYQPTAQASQPTGRLFILDMFKAISIVAVVSYHSVFVPQSTYADSELLIEGLFVPFRFCVPVLLTISFLLLERGLSDRSNESIWHLLKKRLLRLAVPTLFWFSFATALKLVKGNSPVDLLGEIWQGEIFTGAYYLIILFQFLPLQIYFRHWLSKPKNIAITIVAQAFIFLFVHAAMSKVFGSQLLQLLKFIGRPLFIYWIVYLALGIFIYRNLPAIVQLSNRLSVQVKALLLFLAIFLMKVEYNHLFSDLKGSTQPFEYTMFSCVISVAVVFLCFASVTEQQLPLRLREAVTLLSKYSLGIFCINGTARQVFLSFGSRWFGEVTFNFPTILAMKLLGWILLLAVSLALSMLLARVGLKKVVC